MSQALTLIVPGDPNQRTGGYLYDRQITEQLRTLGRDVEVIGLEGAFPLADETAFNSMDTALAALADGTAVVIDGLALGAVPDAVARHAHRLDLSALVHHPLADETGLSTADQALLLERERRALALCRRVIVTSRFTALRLHTLGLSKQHAFVVEPGVEAATLAPSTLACLNHASEPAEQHLLCVASLTPRKGQDVLLTALAGLPTAGWRCRLSGSAQRDPDFADNLKNQIKRSGLSDRVELAGERNEAELAADYDWATVCVLPSHYEGYGMVVTEALARGLPVISTTGGALADTLPDDAGLKVAPNRPDQLGQAIGRWLSDLALRRDLTLGASRARARLPDWRNSAQRFAEALARDQPQP